MVAQFKQLFKPSDSKHVITLGSILEHLNNFESDYVKEEMLQMASVVAISKDNTLRQIIKKSLQKPLGKIT